MQYAGFWARLVALLVDTAIAQLIVLLLMLGLYYGLSLSGMQDLFAPAASVLATAVYFLYWPVLESSARQATFGKQIMGLQVGDALGARTSFLRALLRNLAKIVSYLPLGLGFLMAAFTERKQALHDIITKCVVLRTGESRFFKALAVAVGGVVLMAAGGAAMFYYLIVPHFVQGMDRAMRDAVKGAPQAKAPARKPGGVAKTPAPTADARARRGDPKQLGEPLAGIDKPSSVRVGPGIVYLDTFFSGKDPKVWMKVLMPQNAHLAPGSVVVTVSGVRCARGGECYNAASTFEKTELFQSVMLHPEASPVPHLAGNRTVHLLDGTGETDVQAVQGSVRVRLPDAVKTLELGAGDVGKERPLADLAVRLDSLKDDRASISVTGPAGRFAGLSGLDAAGKAVAGRAESQSGGGSAHVYGYKFQAPVARVRVAAGEQTLHYDFPFTLVRGQAPAPVAAAAAAPPAPVPKVATAPVAPPPEMKKAMEEMAKGLEKAMKEAMKPVAEAKPAPPAPPPAEAKPKPRSISKPEVVALLPEPPAKPGPKFNDVMTAVLYGDRAAVAELLDMGRWPDKPDAAGRTPLVAAAMLRDAPIAELLLSRGANANARGPGGESALSVAEANGDGAMMSLLQRHGAR